MDPPLSQIVRCQHKRDWDWAQREKADDFKQTGKRVERRGTRRVQGSSTFTNSKVSTPKRLVLGTKGKGR